ncbi:ECF transporter S component [Lactiplantibacillus plantarum]|uniref:ECF transporter S component n=1 Tax=Lactiplantibacillus plantarum TaxID=1590 RepID=UPI003C12BD50
MALLGLLTALCALLRIVKLPIPNVQPVTDIIMLVTLLFGIREGITLSILTILVSNIYLGLGIWTLPQIFAYSICTLTIALLRKITPIITNFWLQLLTSFFLGLEYGVAVSLGMALIGSAPAFIAYYTSGFLFDIYHAMGNLLFYPLIVPTLRNLLIKNYEG